tara:strand:+ start:1494 stop:3608 length:2115 start_codon:yes stop_codon:yes gene_type:complete
VVLPALQLLSELLKEKKVKKRFILLSTFYLTSVFAQEDFQFTFEPPELQIQLGESKKVTIRLLDKQQNLVKSSFSMYSAHDPGIGPTPDWPGTSLSISPRVSDETGKATVSIEPNRSGTLKLKVRGANGATGEMIVMVPKPAVKKIDISAIPPKVYVGTFVPLKFKIIDASNNERDDVELSISSSDDKKGRVDVFNTFEAKKTGTVKVSVKAEKISETFKIKIVSNPVRRISMDFQQTEIRTGDVLHINAKALAGNGSLVKDAPLDYAYFGKAGYGEYGLPASAYISEDGRFVAETPGLYTLVVSSGSYSSQKKVNVVSRNVKKEVRLVGHGLISNVKSGDLWVWPGVGKHSGKDFAATGSIFGDGEAYFWDVTDPANMKIIDTVKVDARNVNDVKVSEDGRTGVITREGASNRKNGFVILDVSDPFNVKILSTFNDDMTGGVHNTFIYKNHVYAVNNGRKYDIINIEDPKNPFRVGVFELNTAGHAIHDVWIENGIAYSSNWRDGIVAVDIGGSTSNEKESSDIGFNPLLLKAGNGSPSNPVQLASFPDFKGRNHSAFPFSSQSTGNFYIVMGDEVFPNGLENLINNKPSQPRGGFHFINFSDPDNPVEDAAYIVPEAGSHNQWVYGDVLLAAFYQGGIRILDISGELLGDLYKQEREIGYFLPQHRDGIIPNAPMVWGAQPYKDYIFLSDMNSGLYCIEVVD